MSINLRNELRYIGQDFKNIWYRTKFMFYRFLLPSRIDNHGHVPPEGYTVLFEDDFKSGLDHSKWTFGPAWGEYHPDDIKKNRPHGSYLKDPEAYEFTGDGLVLKTIRKDTTVTYTDDNGEQKEHTFHYVAGSFQQRKDIAQKYGYFECECKMPKKGCWPAFWSFGTVKWPPEIDGFEYWNHHSGRIKSGTVSGPPNSPLYNGFKWFFPRKGYTRIGKKRLQEQFNRYAWEWTPDYVRMYFNGVLIHEVTQFIEWQRGETQLVVIGNGPCSRSWNDIQPGETVDFTVRWVKTYEKAK